MFIIFAYMLYTIGLKGLPFDPHPQQIIYAENTFNQEVNTFIRLNYNRIYNHFRQNGYEFCYLPLITSNFHNQIKSYYLINKNPIPTQGFDSDFLLHYMAHPENRAKIPPSLIYHKGYLSVREGEDLALRGISIDEIDNQDKSFASLLAAKVEDRNSNQIYFSIGASYAEDDDIDNEVNLDDNISFTPPDPTPYLEEQFDVETQQMLREVQVRIERLKQKGISLYILEQLLQDQPKVSRMVITKEYQILLPDYDNAKIYMTPIVKAVYFLFLHHPEGIPFKHLSDYYDELLKIYIRIKGGRLTEEMKRSVLYATSPFNNSINEKCARIREAFIERFDERYITPYIVQGERGCPKHISLPRELVKWEEPQKNNHGSCDLFDEEI